MTWAGRWVCVAGALGVLVVPAAALAAPPAFSAETVRERARALAQHPYEAPAPLPEGAFTRLSYEQTRDIRYRPERALWRPDGLPFQAQFFHPGGLFSTPLPMHEVVGGRVAPVRFSPALYTYGALVTAPPPPGLEGFAGVRFTHPLNRPDHFDEVVAFLGASYFRALGRGNVYGLSARGLAIDTALPEGEEFPLFREFWLERPAPGADRLVLHALLDGPSVTGAYRFVIVPGERTEVEVEAELHARRAVRRLGVAPLTSMYFFGENDRGDAEDFRPEVHDSDGLVLWMKDGERLWRPLQNPPRLQVSTFQVKALGAFGLVQRDQAFTSYEDLEARYDRRPSVWVEPVGDWGPGQVQLVELPTRDEVTDNIVAAWVPEQPVRAGATLRLAWRLSWGSAPPAPSPVAPLLATRSAPGGTPGARRFVLDFARGGPEGGAGPVEPVVTASSGQVLHPTVQPNPVTGGWRATFEVVPDAGPAPTELRCLLRRGTQTLTETWSYPWIP